MMWACLVKGLIGVRTLSAWLVPQANSFHTYFLTDSTLPQKIHGAGDVSGQAEPGAISVPSGAESSRSKGCGLSSECSVKDGPMS